MPRMVHRRKEKPGARGCVRSCNAGRSDRGSWHTHSQTVQQRAVRSRTALKAACYAQYTTECCEMQI